jgi:hypothetical protein
MRFWAFGMGFGTGKAIPKLGSIIFQPHDRNGTLRQSPTHLWL